MGTAAVNAARAVDYRGAGTVEFLLDADGSFYFLEMNTRLQVEHPVTEEVTGLDLVALQIRVARGEPLAVEQEDVSLRGHAIEVRLYAEDPTADFLPSTGHVTLWRPPTGPGVRVDAGIESGGEVSPFYDPMVAKIIARGDSREEARQRLIAALGATALFGPANNRDFLIDVLKQPVFADGLATTNFIGETYGEAGYSPPPLPFKAAAPAIALQHLIARDRVRAQTLDIPDELLGWSSTHDLETCATYRVGNDTFTTWVRPRAEGLSVSSGDTEVTVAIDLAGPHAATLRVDGARSDVTFEDHINGSIKLATGTTTFEARNLSRAIAGQDAEAGGGHVVAPMHGKLIEINVGPGDSVKKGDKLAVLEAMKMQHELVAERSTVPSNPSRRHRALKSPLTT